MNSSDNSDFVKHSLIFDFLPSAPYLVTASQLQPADVNEKFFCPRCHDDDSVRAGEAADHALDPRGR